MGLEKLYNLVLTHSRKFRRIHEDEDFMTPWHKLEVYLTKHDYHFNQWNSDVLKGGMAHGLFTDKVMDLPEKIITGYGEEELIEQNHFMIQIFRIPLTEKPSLVNLLKIAHYSGLLTAKLAQRDFPEGIVHALKELKMLEHQHFIDGREAEKLIVSETMLKQVRRLIKGAQIDETLDDTIHEEDSDESDSD